MTEQDQRIVIAEACGWTFNHQRKTATAPLNACWKDKQTSIDWAKNSPKPWDCFANYDDWLPDYLHDLNAMHEAENWLLDGPLTDTLGINYWNNLWFVAKDPHNTLRSIGNATATQRAEAVLRTIGKWKD